MDVVGLFTQMHVMCIGTQNSVFSWQGMLNVLHYLIGLQYSTECPY